MSFLPKREQKVAVILLASKVMVDVGEGLASSLPGACWCVTSVQLWSSGLQCVQSLPLTCPPSVLTQKVRIYLLPHLFLFFSAVSPVWSVSFTPSFCCPALRARAVFWLFLSWLVHSRSDFHGKTLAPSYYRKERRVCVFYLALGSLISSWHFFKCEI